MPRTLYVCSNDQPMVGDPERSLMQLSLTGDVRGKMTMTDCQQITLILPGEKRHDWAFIWKNGRGGLLYWRTDNSRFRVMPNDQPFQCSLTNGDNVVVTCVRNGVFSIMTTGKTRLLAE